jgi:hypothetical protein
MLWEKEILPSWDLVKKTRKVRELWVDGIPTSVRGRAWSLACGNACVLTVDLFLMMADRGCMLSNMLRRHIDLEAELSDAVYEAES